MVGHPHVNVDAEAKPTRRLDECITEKQVVGIGRKNSLTVVTALDIVLRLTGNDVAG